MATSGTTVISVRLDRGGLAVDEWQAGVDEETARTLENTLYYVASGALSAAVEMESPMSTFAPIATHVAIR